MFNISFSQQSFNFDFENLDAKTGLPKGIGYNADQQNKYAFYVDSLYPQHGKYAVVLEQKDPSAQFGAFSFIINPSFSGKKLTLKGYIRTENVDGFAGLWIRVDGTGSVLSFDNMQNQHVIGTRDWAQYQVNVDFDEDQASSIIIGGLLVGKGKIWLDHFELLVDGKDLSALPFRKKILLGAQLDTAYRHGSLVQKIELNKTIINRLNTLGKVWGFLKYYHPAIGAGRFNWDAEFLRVLPKVLAVRSNNSLG